MKKLISSLLLLAVSVAVLAQVEKKEYTAFIGETTVEHQGSYTPSFKVDGSNAKIRNVILMIGDGMGLAAVNAGMYANGGELTLTNLRSFGFVRTQSANNFITDSAASGTAYACGIKTNNNFLGMDPDQNSVPNLPEKLEPLGFVCGVVSSDDMNGATPAAFFAHQNHRNKTPQIWADLANAHLAFASAGSMPVFDKQSEETRNAILGKFTLVDKLEEVKGMAAPVLFLPPSVLLADRGDYLPATTREAIEFLSAQKGSKGFFLMVEGARIDKEEHSNNCAGFVREMLDFDKAVEEAIRFAEKDGHTLVIISADHETGGVALRGGRPADGYIQTAFAATGHTAISVPVYTYGPKSDQFRCYLENSDVSNKIFELLTAK